MPKTVKMHKINYNGNYMIFNSKLINKPVELRLLQFINNDMVLVHNLSGDDPTEILRWGLKPKSLQQKVPHFKRIFDSLCNGHKTIIRVVYHGKIKGKETFDIKQKACGEYYPITYDLSYISKRETDFAIHAPALLGGGTICGGESIETAIRIRDFFKNRGYNFYEFSKGKKSARGVAARVEKYAQTHTKLDYEELIDIYYSKKIDKQTITVPIDEYDEFLRFKRFKEMESKGGLRND